MLRASVLVVTTVLAWGAAHAEPGSELARLLAAPAPPAGVVFEVVSGNEAELDGLLPVIHGHTRNLRDRFPHLPVAVLTHGAEQFSLLSEHGQRYAPLHRLTQDLGERQRVAVQVCGNHASWRDKGREDFPAYVDVVSSAGEQLARYRAAGYVVIRM